MRSTRRLKMARRKTFKRGGSKAAALAGLLATATGQQSQLVGPGSYAMGPPFPSRQGSLNVYPTPTPQPRYSMTTAEHASQPVWPVSTTSPAPSWLDPSPGTRWVAPPEIQTWNPYLRGDPNEVVDYYEGYSNADRKTREAENVAAGIETRPKVARKNTPMWKAAQVWSADLPDITKTETPGLTHQTRWQFYRNRGRNYGMNIPEEDPRLVKPSNARWLGAAGENVMPKQPQGEVLSSQLYHAGLWPASGPGAWAGENGQYSQMKSGPKPKIWRRSTAGASN